MFLWKSNNLKTSNLFVIINKVAQLGYIATAPEPLDRRSTPNFSTYIVAETIPGIGILDLLHNTSAAYYRDVPPSGLVQIATGVCFVAAASVSDWIFGGCLVYDVAPLVLVWLERAGVISWERMRQRQLESSGPKTTSSMSGTACQDLERC